MDTIDNRTQGSVSMMLGTDNRQAVVKDLTQSEKQLHQDIVTCERMRGW